MKKRKKEKVDFDAGWSLGWYRRRFREIIRTPGFDALVTLARLANMIRFVQTVVVTSQGQGPENRRQGLNAFFMAGGLLVEAERTIQMVGSSFSGDEAFIELARIVHGEDFVTVVERFRPFRNQAGFHFDLRPVKDSLGRIVQRDKAFFSFLTGHGPLNRDLYYDLADQTAMELLLGEDGYGDRMDRWVELNAKVINALFDAIDAFVALKLGALKPVSVPTEGDDPPRIERPNGPCEANRSNGL